MEKYERGRQREKKKMWFMKSEYQIWEEDVERCERKTEKKMSEKDILRKREFAFSSICISKSPFRYFASTLSTFLILTSIISASNLSDLEEVVF